MTPEMAIRILSDDTPGTISQIQEAVKMGAEALVSRIPQKVRIRVHGYDTIYCAYCPACDGYLWYKGKYNAKIGSKPVYCCYCGQRLDWSNWSDITNFPK